MTTDASSDIYPIERSIMHASLTSKVLSSSRIFWASGPIYRATTTFLVAIVRGSFAVGESALPKEVALYSSGSGRSPGG